MLVVCLWHLGGECLPPRPSLMSKGASIRRCLVVAASTLHPSARGKRRARPFCPPPPCTVHRRAGASLLRSVGAFTAAHAATMQAPAGASSWLRALSTRVPEVESATAVHRGVGASLLRSFVASMAAPSQRCKHPQVPGRGGKHSPPECQRQTTSTHLEPATAVHRGVGASLLDQSER